MKKVKLIRFMQTADQTLGFMDIDGRIIWTLELPWRNNQVNVSCIPAGKYRVKKRKSVKHGWHYHIWDVENRTLILIHAGNFVSDILGCVLVGQSIEDINHDALPDVKYSKAALNTLLTELGNDFELEIIERF